MEADAALTPKMHTVHQPSYVPPSPWPTSGSSHQLDGPAVSLRSASSEVMLKLRCLCHWQCNDTEVSECHAVPAVWSSLLKQLHPSVQTGIKPLLMPVAAAVLKKLLQADKAAAAAAATMNGLHKQQGTNPVPVMVVVTEQEEEA